MGFVWVSLVLVGFVGAFLWVAEVRWEELRPAMLGDRLVGEFVDGPMAEVDGQLLVLGPLLAACREDDRRMLSREFGTAVHNFYWDRLSLAEFRDICASIIEAAERRRVWF